MEKIDPRITDQICNHLLDMGYDSLHNYIVPGLVSTLIGEDRHASAKIRIFRNTRTQDEFITPHSHRFDLACMVLQGSVENTIFMPVPYPNVTSDIYSDEYQVSRLIYEGSPGKYDKADAVVQRFGRFVNTYKAGQWYFLKFDEIHSIKFSKDAIVLIFEGDSKTDTTTVLEPHVNSKTIRTFKVEDWMFQP
jgi:hypothetical protein